MSYQVFISHSSKNSDIACTMKEYLEHRGIKCWKAPEDIPIGLDWDVGIKRGLSECPVMILIFSRAADESKHVKIEVHKASDAEKILIPFRIESYIPDNLDYYLTFPQWLDAIDDIEGAFERLYQRLRSIVKLSSSPPNGVTTGTEGLLPAPASYPKPSNIRATGLKDYESLEGMKLRYSGPGDLRAEARLIENGRKIVVEEHSQCSLAETPSCPDSIRSLRRQLLDEGVLDRSSSGLQFIREYVFKSPSQASSVVYGGSSNGRTCWTDQSGHSLNEIYNSVERGKLESSPTPPSCREAANILATGLKDYESLEGMKLRYSGPGDLRAEARLIENGRKIVVEALSQCSLTETASCPDSIRSLRRQLLDEGVLDRSSSGLQFVREYVFKSPSQASSVVYGGSSNGRTCWTDLNGTTLSMLIDQSKTLL
jgi:hypothetical protein